MQDNEVPSSDTVHTNSDAFYGIYIKIDLPHQLVTTVCSRLKGCKPEHNIFLIRDNVKFMSYYTGH